MTHLLDLSTLVERPTIAVDGAAYELRTPDELSVLDLTRLQSWGRRLQALGAQGEIGEAEASELAMIADKIVSLVVVDLPAEVRDRLSFAQKAKIGEVFTQLSPQTAARGGRKAISARRSAPSNGATAGPPGNG